MPEIAIIGAGFAGLTLVRRLLERGVDPEAIAVIDAADDERASDVPAALTHPFPGRSMQPKPGQLTAAKASADFLRAIGAEAPAAVLETTMVRPLEGKLGEKLRDSFTAMQGSYPDWFDARLVAAPDLVDVDANLAGVDEALVYGPAFSVDTANFRRHLRRQFAEAGVALVDQTEVDHARRTPEGWRLETDAAPVEASKVVLALGWSIAEWFPRLPIHGRGGEVLVVRPPRGAELGCIINHSGHVAPLPDGTWAAGSTYWKPDKFGARTDEQAIADLLERCVRLAPPLADAEPLRVGRGVRAMYRGDNRPLVGAVPDQPGMFVFGALGSKGLHRIPELATQLAARLCEEGAIDERATTTRVKPEKWAPIPARISS